MATKAEHFLNPRGYTALIQSQKKYFKKHSYQSHVNDLQTCYRELDVFKWLVNPIE